MVYYRTYTMRQVLARPQAGRLEYDKTNQLHLAACGLGRAKLERCPVAVIRESWFVGPHHLVDRPCSAPTNVPAGAVLGYRKDRTGEPYGLIAPSHAGAGRGGTCGVSLTFCCRPSASSWIKTPPT